MTWWGWAILAAAGVGSATVAQKVAVQSLGWRWATVFDLMVGALCIALFCLPGAGKPGFAWKGLLAAAFAGLAGATAFVSSNRAMSMADAAKVSPVIAAGPAIAVILALVLLHEKLTPLQLVGVLLTFAGGYFVIWGKSGA